MTSKIAVMFKRYKRVAREKIPSSYAMRHHNHAVSWRTKRRADCHIKEYIFYMG